MRMNGNVRTRYNFTNTFQTKKIITTQKICLVTLKRRKVFSTRRFKEAKFLEDFFLYKKEKSSRNLPTFALSPPDPDGSRRRFEKISSKFLAKVKKTRAQGGCPGTGSRRRTRQAAKSCAKEHISIEAQVSE